MRICPAALHRGHRPLTSFFCTRLLHVAMSSTCLIVDTDCGLDDLAALALATATEAPIQLVTTVNGLAPPGYGHLVARRLLEAVGQSAVPVVAGAETPPAEVVRKKEGWELMYTMRLATVLTEVGIEPVDEPVHIGDADTAANAILDAARDSGGNATVLALGALTNLAAAAELHPDGFRRYLRRIVFIGDTDPSRRSYNVALDPAAVRAVMRTGVEVVLIGQACYAPTDWVAELFSRSAEGDGDSGAGDQGDAEKRPDVCSQADAGAAARVLRGLGQNDPYSMSYDTLALLYHMQPDAFELSVERHPVRVTCGTDWRFERCDASEMDGLVIEPSGVSLERYEAFLASAGALAGRKVKAQVR